jgi:hypothetical protein
VIGPTDEQLLAWYVRGETSRTLGHLKDRALKELCAVREPETYDQLLCAVALLSLGREDEALRVVAAAHRRVVFRGSYTDAVYGAAKATAIASWIRRRAGDTMGARAEMNRFVDQPVHALQPGGRHSQTDLWTREQFAVALASIEERAATLSRMGPPEREYVAIAESVGDLIFLGEFARIYPEHGGKVDEADLLDRIQRALMKIGAQVQPG